MQQGLAATRDWVLEFETEKPLQIEPLMGWTSTSETKQQVRLSFATKEEAVAYATRHGIAFRLEEPQKTALRPKSYAENFKFGRPYRWTH
jgi:hypothetical protein